MNTLLACLLIVGLSYPLGVLAGQCNKVQCASVVSKCMLTQACKCKLSKDKEECECCVNCAKCLGMYYQQCCTCLGMCDDGILGIDPNDSQVGDFDDPFVQLFEAVTQSEGVDGLVISYPADLPLEDIAKFLQKTKYKKENYKNDALPQPISRLGVNCTVAFMSQCHSANKCREQCKSIGSGSYRFFFNGCCECVGATCLNYGINESKCPLCSDHDDMFYNHHMMEEDEITVINELDKDFIP